MGGQNSTQSISNIKQSLIGKLTDYDDVFTERFGRIKIYTYTQKSVVYIMRFRQMAISDPKVLLKLQQKQKWYRDLKEHRNIVQIHDVELIEDSQMCIRKICLDLYAKYYNKTLQNAVDIKLEKQIKFRENDLLYIIESLLWAAKFLHENTENNYTGLFSIKNIYLSPEGFIKIYPFPLDFDLHVKGKSPKRNIKKFHSMIEPELTLQISRKTSDSANTTPCVQKQKTKQDDIRQIGIILLQLTQLNKFETEYLYASTGVIQETIQILRVQQKITPEIKELLEKMLLGFKDNGVEKLIQLLQNFKINNDKSFSSCIRLEEGPKYEGDNFNKTNRLRRLSLHGNLKPQNINVCSRGKKQ